MTKSGKKKKILAKGRFIQLVDRGGWEYVERFSISGIVVIIGVTRDGNLVLTEQYRPPVDARVIELPAGLVGDIAGREFESEEYAARRELLEETGYEAERMKLLMKGPPSCGLNSEVISLYRAEGLVKTGLGGGDEQEKIQVHEVPLRSIDSWLNRMMRRGIMVDPKVYIGIHFAGRRARR